MPDYTDQDEVRRWLEEQAAGPPKQRENIVAFAARCALRVLPLVEASDPLNGPGWGSPAQWAGEIVLPVFRADAASFALARYPDKGTRWFAGDAARAASDAVTVAEAIAIPDDFYALHHRKLEDYAAAAAAYAADGTARAARTAAYAAEVTASAKIVANTSFTRAASAAARTAADVPVEATYAAAAHIAAAAGVAASLDIDALISGETGKDLARRPIWLDGVPDSIAQYWSDMCATLSGLRDDWGIWIDWYDARLAGRPTYPRQTERENKGIESARVDDLSDRDWQKGPTHVHAMIRGIEVRFGVHSEDAADEEDRSGIEDARPSSQPIDIPPLNPAAIEPVWHDGVLGLPAAISPSGSPEGALEAALAILRESLEDLTALAAGSGNSDPRFIAYLEKLTTRIPRSAPRQVELFRLAHENVVLRGYAETVADEWPKVAAAQYQAFVLTFERTVRQFPDWREFVANAEDRRMTPDDVAAVAESASALAAELSGSEAQAVVAAELPAALLEFGNALESEDPLAAIERGKEQLAVDLLDGIENICKRVAEMALTTAIREGGKDYADRFPKAVRKAIGDLGDKHGEAAVKWSVRLLIGGGGGYGVISVLLARFPEIRVWLEPIIKLLGSL